MYNIYLNSLNDLMSEEFVYYSSNFTDWNYNKMIKLKDVLYLYLVLIRKAFSEALFLCSARPYYL